MRDPYPLAEVDRKVRRDLEVRPGTITPRVLGILADLGAHRFLTTHQLRRLHFVGRDPSRAQKRLLFLCRCRLIDRLWRPRVPRGSLPWVYVLDRAGHEELRRRGLARGRWREENKVLEWSRVRHALEVNELGVAATEALGARLTEWRGEAGAARPRDHVYPDAEFVVDAEHSVLVEWDRSEHWPKHRRKLAAYQGLLADAGVGPEAPVVVFVCRDHAHRDRAMGVARRVRDRLHPNLCYATAGDLDPAAPAVITPSGASRVLWEQGGGLGEQGAG